MMANNVIRFPGRREPPRSESRPIAVGDVVRCRSDGAIARVYLIMACEGDIRVYVEIAGGLHRGVLRCVEPDEIEPWPHGGGDAA